MATDYNLVNANAGLWANDKGPLNTMFDRFMALKDAQTQRDRQAYGDELQQKQFELQQQLQQAKIADIQRKAQTPDFEALEASGLYKISQGQEASPAELAAMKASDALRQTKLTVNPTTGLPMPAARSIFDVLGMKQTAQPAVAPQNTVLDRLIGMPGQSIDAGEVPPVDVAALDPSAGIKLDGKAPMPSIMDRMEQGASYEPPAPQNPRQEAEAYGSKLKMAEEQAKAGLDTVRKRDELQTKANVDRAEAQPKVLASVRALSDNVNNIDKTIDEAISKISPKTTGFGSVLSNIPGTSARDLDEILNTVRADAAFTTLQEMRANSPTGGALGAVSEKELKLLESAQSALSTAQSPAQLRRKLQEYKMQRKNALMRVKKAYRDTYGELPDLGEGGSPTNETGSKSFKFLGFD